MTTVHYIHYIDRFGTPQKIKFSEVFEVWVNSFGGKRQFVHMISNASSSYLFAVPHTFLMFFMGKFKATLSDDVAQDYLYDPELYDMYINEVIKEHQDNPLNPQRIITLVVIVLAIFGLVSMCS